MKPIQSYFDWHDARVLARVGDSLRNQRDIRLLRTMRVPLFVSTALIFVLLLGAAALTALSGGSLAEEAVLVFGVLFAPVTLFYTLVTEALLFRRYVDEHTTKS